MEGTWDIMERAQLEAMSSEELKELIESGAASEDEKELANEILTKREVFAKFPDADLRNCLNSDVYDDVDKGVIRALMKARASESDATILQSIESMLERQNKDIHLMRNCIVFFTVIVAISVFVYVALGFNTISELANLAK